MLKEQLADFFKDLGYILKKIFTSRMVPFAAAGAVLFAILIIKLFNMQIVHGDDYTDSYIMKAEKTVTTTGTRGDIYDTNGKLLAYSELAYSVVIEDSGTYTSTSVKNASINAVIAKMIEIIENNGDSIDYDFGLACNESGYYYTVSDNALLRFLRDMYGRSAISKLTDDERNSTPADSAEVLRNRYKIYTAEDVENLKKAEAAKQAKNPKFKLTDYDSLNIYDDITAMRIAYVRYNLAANSYKRYLSFTVSSNVNEHTMAAILENKDILTGVSIEEDTVRKYNYSEYIAHIIGYTGKVSSDQLEELQAIDSSYDATDIVGKSGIEQQYETTLSGTKGTRTMLVDNVGRVLEVTNEVEAVAGKDVYLTIDIDLQEKIYKLLERRLAEIVVSYLTQSDSPFKDDGQILIPIKDVYFALINNNVIDIDKIASSDTAAAQTTYSLFSTQKNTVLAAINADLESGDTAYGAQTDDMKSYLKLVRRILIDDGIINSDKITASDDLSKQWTAGNISLRQYLEGAINNQWVNIYNLDISSDYPTTDEVLASVLDYASDAITKSTDFDKLIYEYLINNHILSGREICLLLMEQGAVKYTESEYVNITNGGSTFDFLETKIANLDITPAQLALDPCSGSCVVEDPNSGSILAMVSYPSYDINYFSGSINADYYNKLLNDKSTPLVNRATQTKIAPGSTFKPLIAVAGLAEGVITPNDTVYCDGIYDKITPNIKCWIHPDKHGSVNTESALEHSCNEYFCDIGYRLCFTPGGEISFEYGLSREKKYAELLGLGTKTGIQLPESTPQISDYNAVASAIGQGTNAYTSLNLARYVSTLANFGTVYNSSIVSRISDSDGSNVEFIGSTVANTVDIDPSIWTTVRNGMERVITKGVMNPLTSNLPVTIYGKSGTAQEDKTRGDHACYIMYSTDDDGNAELATAVMIPYGHSATHAGVMAYYAMASYYDYELPSSIIFNTSGGFDITE